MKRLGTFSLSVQIDKLFFIGSQLVALSKTGKVGIWHSMTQNWQVQGIKNSKSRSYHKNISLIIKIRFENYKN